MTESTHEIRERLMAGLPGVKGCHTPRETARQATTSVVVPPRNDQPPVIVVQGTDRLTMTAPVTELLPSESAGLSAAMAKRLYVKLRGRFVEAEKANGNGAYWSAGDLEVGLPSVSYGPLNWLHNERTVVGVLSDAAMVQREAAAAMQLGPHIQADAIMWRWLYPQQTRLVEKAADEHKLWYSMECIAPEIECVGPNGCGTKVPYLDAMRREGASCAHIKNREATRRFVNPIFQGGAIIVPPVTPGWASADLTVVREAASVLEGGALGSDLGGLKDEEAAQMVQQVLEFARRPA